MSHLLCLDATDGRALWSHHLPKEYETTEDLRGPNCSPIIESNLVIVAIAKSPQISIVAFDKDSGRQVWESLDEIPPTLTDRDDCQAQGALFGLTDRSRATADRSHSLA
jgi:outer membrane protein assembly factor BamB